MHAIAYGHCVNRIWSLQKSQKPCMQSGLTVRRSCPPMRPCQIVSAMDYNARRLSPGYFLPLIAWAHIVPCMTAFLFVPSLPRHLGERTVELSSFRVQQTRPLKQWLMCCCLLNMEHVQRRKIEKLHTPCDVWGKVWRALSALAVCWLEYCFLNYENVPGLNVFERQTDEL